MMGLALAHIYLRLILQRPKGDPERRGPFCELHGSLGSSLLFMLSHQLIKYLFWS